MKIFPSAFSLPVDYPSYFESLRSWCHAAYDKFIDFVFCVTTILILFFVMRYWSRLISIWRRLIHPSNVPEQNLFSSDDVIYESRYLIVRHKCGSEVLELYWKNKQTEYSIQREGTRILFLIRVFEIKAIMNSNRSVTSNWSGISNWVRETWFSRVMALGVRQVAWILPENSDAAREAALKARPSGFGEIRFFLSERDAEQWLSADYRDVRRKKSFLDILREIKAIVKMIGGIIKIVRDVVKVEDGFNLIVLLKEFTRDLGDFILYIWKEMLAMIAIWNLVRHFFDF